MFGGANFETEMGLEFIRTMPGIDYIAMGEADRTFPEFLLALDSGTDPAEVPGVACLRGGEVRRPVSRPPFEEMDGPTTMSSLSAPRLSNCYRRGRGGTSQFLSKARAVAGGAKSTIALFAASTPAA